MTMESDTTMELAAEDSPGENWPTTSETIERLLGRVSVRSFSNQPVSDETVDAILGASVRAPTSSNIQAYSLIVVRDPEVKAQLAEAVGNQAHVAACPVFLAFCADLTRIEQAMVQGGYTINDNNLEMGLVSSIDAALVGMSAYLAAETLGLDGVMIGAVRNNPAKISELLGLPHRAYCVFGMCLGFAETVPPQKPRMALDTVVHREQYDASQRTAEIRAYDDALAEHYRSQGRRTNDNSWSQEIVDKFSVRPRDRLREQLDGLGFDFR